jgi:hypothetical protein
VLTRAERGFALRGENIVMPRATITKVMLTDDAWIWLRGFRRRGTHVPGVIAAGTWKSGNGEDFVLVRGHRPSVVIELDGSGEFTRIVLTTRHGIELVKALRLDVESEASDVAELVGGVPEQEAPAAEVRPAKPRRARAPKTAPAPA